MGQFDGCHQEEYQCEELGCGGGHYGRVAGDDGGCAGGRGEWESTDDVSGIVSEGSSADRSGVGTSIQLYF